MTSGLERLARFCADHRRAVVVVWVLVAVGATLAVRAADVEARSELRVPGSDSQVALDLLGDRFPAFAGISAQVVFHDPDGVERHEDEIVATLREVSVLDDVTLVSAPFGPGVISPDGTTTIVTVRYSKGQSDLPGEAYGELVDTVTPIADESLVVEVGGALGFFDAQETSTAELLGFVAAVVILLLAFGSVIAMGLPLVSAVVGLGVGLAAVNVLGASVDMPRLALTLGTMIGIGVGIDYALFIVTRYREVLGHYRWEQNAIAVAARTSGKAVVFAGGTVVISILGLVISGVPFVFWLGVAAGIVVLVMVLASATLIPALLAFSGRGIDRFRVPVVGRVDKPIDQRLWVRWGRHISAHPWPWMLAGVLVLVVLSLPLFSMRLAQSDAGSLPEETSHRRAYDLIAERFGPGANGPLLVAVDLRGGGDVAAVEADGAVLASRSDVASVGPVLVNPDGDAAVYQVIPVDPPDAEATEALVGAVRTEVLPSGVEATGASAHVAGTTANFIDLADRIGQRLPWFIGAIVLASFLLLVVMFRSLLVPLKAAVLNLLSIGAGYGVIVAVFQWGWAKGLVGLEDTVPITSVIPMFMFAVLFGLSMDYEVFLLSRVKEEYDRTGDNTESVVHGIASTGRIITSAAAIMVCVFFGFVLSDDPMVKMAGLGLGTAILVDATIVRAILVPSTMRLLGHANWWLPAWLDRVLPAGDPPGPRVVDVRQPSASSNTHGVLGIDLASNDPISSAGDGSAPTARPIEAASSPRS